MFNFDNAPHAEALDERIGELLEELDALTGSTEEYSTTVTNLVKLMELRDKNHRTTNESTKIENDRVKHENDLALEHNRFLNEQEKVNIEHEKIRIDRDKVKLDREKFEMEKQRFLSWKPSPDAVITAAGSMLGILAILHYEKLGIISSKALSFVSKLK